MKRPDSCCSHPQLVARWFPQRVTSSCEVASVPYNRMRDKYSVPTPLFDNHPFAMLNKLPSEAG